MAGAWGRCCTQASRTTLQRGRTDDDDDDDDDDEDTFHLSVR
jgi:hypothetical protein